MPDRLEIYSCTIDLDTDDTAICIGGFAVLDNTAGIVRKVSLTLRGCEIWIESQGHKYPESDDEDGLS